MAWGIVELEPEVRDWLEQLPTARFAQAAFHVDLLAEQGPLLGEPYTRQLDGKRARRALARCQGEAHTVDEEG